MRKILSSLCAVFMACAAYAGLRFDVTNPTFERVQEPVFYRLSPEELAETEGCALFELNESGNKVAVPFSIAKLDDAAYISWVMGGLTEVGAVRTFLMESGKQEATEPTDLSVTDDGKLITVGNQYFSTSHKMHGGGSLAAGVKFNLSGNADQGLMLYDRIALPNVPSLNNDSESTAKVVFSSPLLVIVEANARYMVSFDKVEKGNPRARYRFFYQSFTPLVHVELLAERDTEEGWKELHFLHLSNARRYYNRNVTGNPATVFNYQPKGEKSVYHRGEDWGVMEKGTDAVGVGGASVGCWDASSEFVYYVRNLSATVFNKEKRVAASGLLYYGQSQKEASDYSRWLRAGDRPLVKASAVKNAAAVVEKKPMDAPHVFELGGLRLAFADAEHGFAVVGLEEKDAEAPRFFETDEVTVPLWKASFRAGNDAKTAVTVDSTTVKGEIRKDDNTITMDWKGISLGEGNGTADVRAWIVGDGRGCDWHISIDTHSDKYGLWESEYPLVGKVFNPSKGSTLLPIGNWGGRLKHNVPCTFTGAYPSAHVPVQFLAFMQNGRGLYVGYHDGYAMYKFLGLSPNQTLTMRLPGENMGVPGSGRDDLFPVRMECYDGDWWKAAKIYRAWASQQKWTSRGCIYKNPKCSESMAKVSFWMEIFASPKEMMNFMIPLAKRAKYPIGIHWYAWTIHPFDTHYPNMRPAKDGMAEAVKAMRENNIIVMPYINGRIWDTTIPEYKIGYPGTCKDENGKPYMEVYPSSYIELATMCPASKIYQDAIEDIAMHLFKEQGINSLYLDQIGAGAPRLCFDKSHGHALGGGRYWVDGYRQLLKPLREYVDANGFSLATENTAEPYMDNIDAFLAWNQREGCDVPVLPAVYSGYTNYFSTPLRAGQDYGRSVRTLVGRDFIWGDVIGWNPEWFLGNNYKDELTYSLDLGAHRYATLDFMAYGELLDEVRPVNAVPMFNVTWYRDNEHVATLPAVQGTVWEAPDGRRCLYIMNHLDGIQKFDYELPLPKDEKAQAWLVRRVRPSGTAPLQIVGKEGAIRSERLKPQELLVLTIEPLNGSAKALAKEARSIVAKGTDKELRDAANSFLLSDKNIPKVDMDAEIEVVKGDNTEVKYVIANDGKAVVAEITWPNGKTEKVNVPAKSQNEYASRQDFSSVADGVADVSFSFSGDSYAVPVVFRKVEPLSVDVRMQNNVYAGEEIPVRLIVTNHSSDAQNAMLVVSAPDTWEVMPSRMLRVSNLKGRGTVCLNLTCKVRDQDADTKDALRISVMHDLAEKKVDVQRTRPRVTGHAANLKMDGKLDDWSQEDIVTIDETNPDKVFYRIKDKPYGGSADCSVQARVAWNSNYLYLAFDVKDDVHASPERGPDVWKGDMIQVEMRAGGPAENSGDTMWHQFAIACDEQGGFMYQWGLPSGGEGVQEAAKVVCSHGEKGNVVYEVAIPWKVLPFKKPSLNSRFGFSFVVADNDGREMKGWLQLTPGIFYGHNSALIGWLTLK